MQTSSSRSLPCMAPTSLPSQCLKHVTIRRRHVTVNIMGDRQAMRSSLLVQHIANALRRALAATETRLSGKPACKSRKAGLHIG